MANFWNALAAVGNYGVPAFRQAQLFAQQQQKQQLDDQASTLRGQVIQGMMTPQPAPEGDGMSMPQTMQRPGASPMPQQAELPGATPMPQTMQRPGTTARGMGAQPKLDWQTAFTTIARDHPGTDPQVIAATVDKLVPFMSEQAQAEWRQLQFGLQSRKVDNAAANTEADNARADERLKLDREKAQHNVEYRTQRLAQIDEQIRNRPKPMERLAPQIRAKIDQLARVYQQSMAAQRTAEISTQYNPGDEGAMKALDEATKKAEKAQSDYLNFIDGLQTGTSAGAGGNGGASNVPTGDAGGATPAPAAAPVKPPGGFPAAELEKPAPPVKPDPATVQRAAPNGQGTNVQPTTPQVYPLPQSKAMMVKDRLYNVPGHPGVPYTWDGTTLVKVRSGKGK